MIRSPATLRALILPVSRYSTMSGAISVESMRTRTGASVSLRIWCAALLAARERDDVALAQLLLALVRAQRRLAAEDDRPFLVRVVSVKWPLLVTRLDLVHARADQLSVGVRADPGVLEAPALALFGAIPLVCVEIEDLHAASLVGRCWRTKRHSFGQSSSTCATARRISSLSEIRSGLPKRRRLPGMSSSTST